MDEAARKLVNGLILMVLVAPIGSCGTTFGDDDSGGGCASQKFIRARR